MAAESISRRTAYVSVATGKHFNSRRSNAGAESFIVMSADKSINYFVVLCSVALGRNHDGVVMVFSRACDADDNGKWKRDTNFCTATMQRDENAVKQHVVEALESRRSVITGNSLLRRIVITVH